MTDWSAYEPCWRCGRSWRCVGLRWPHLMKALKYPHKERRRRNDDGLATDSSAG